MLCIHNKSTEPYFNMAVEEYLFKNFTEDIFMLWRNDNAIIVGKHQNTLAEINFNYVREKGIKVVRRLSGGGTVFHDLGNLNFTFIINGENSSLVDFKKYTLPILEVLEKLGINAKFEGRNDLTIEGKKFSGNAVHVFKNRVLQHGTLLFASEMKDISEALNVDPMKFTDKSVKSVRSRVTNISDHLMASLSLDEFTEMIMSHIKEKYSDAVEYKISGEDAKIIQKLADEKYSTWEWNYGYQAKYNFDKKFRTNGGSIQIQLDVDHGIIKTCKIYGDYFNEAETEEIEQAIINTRHEEGSLRKALSSFNIDRYFKNVTLDDFISGMF